MGELKSTVALRGEAEVSPRGTLRPTKARKSARLRRETLSESASGLDSESKKFRANAEVMGGSEQGALYRNNCARVLLCCPECGHEFQPEAEASRVGRSSKVVPVCIRCGRKYRTLRCRSVGLSLAARAWRPTTRRGVLIGL
jgi:hypothetical protein